MLVRWWRGLILRRESLLFAGEKPRHSHDASSPLSDMSNLCLSSFDSIGCIDFAKDFIVSGTASDQLFGTCEGLWEPDLGPEDLFETISQALLNAVDRDALSGWGAHVYIIEKDKVTKRLLKGRQD